MPIEPDTKDWTWVLERPCPECGYDPAQVDATRAADLLHENTSRWHGVLERPDAAVRPASHVWSRLEYACHVRDVHEVFAGRVHQMLDEDDAQFANWDQDVTALESAYDEQDPDVVAVELVERAAEAAAAYAGVGEGQWTRTGTRSNGSVFTVETLALYHLHDVVHHLWDVGVTPHLPSSGS
ncbi:MAG: DinB family protein [Marmoricola sp.]|nr:DinB family protein [Marmoricola sp.]